MITFNNVPRLAINNYNMKYYKLEPEVAGGIGKESQIIYTEEGRIKEITFLDYEFDGWLGDELLTTTPTFIVSEQLTNDIIERKLTGCIFQDMKVSVSDDFLEFHHKEELPNFKRLVPVNNINSFDELDNSLQDFYAYKLRELIVSEKALSIIKEHSISHCDIIEINATSV